MSKDYERKVQTSETLIGVAMIRLLVARLGRRSEAVGQTLEPRGWEGAPGDMMRYTTGG